MVRLPCGASLRRATLLRVPLAVAVALAGLLVPVMPVHAGTSGALAACRNRQAADSSQLATIYGNGGGNVPAGQNPPNILNSGDVFMLLTGDYPQVKIGSWPWDPSYGPNGNGGAAPTNWPFPGMLQYSAILRFNNNPGGWVGAPTQATAFAGCMVWSGPPVRLLFYVNDPNISDNSGYWWMSFYVYRAALH